MKKSFKIYSLIWAICLAVFNVITFVTPNEIAGVSKFSGSYWVGYIFITIAFIGQWACAFVAFKAENLKKFFYNIPLLSISYGGLVAMLIIGSIFMAIPVLPEWIGIIVCVIILAFNAIACVKATTVANVVSEIDEKIKTNTAFIRTAIVDAENIMARATTSEIKTEAKKVYEALKYSDPMTNPALCDIEQEIDNGLKELKKAVTENDSAKVTEISTNLLLNVKERNSKCKMLK